MALRYSLIVPYFRTPEVTRLALRTMQCFAAGEPEIIVIDNDPNHPGSAMLDEFPHIVRINNPTDTRGSLANFEALDIGIDAASHDRLAIVHSDTIFLQHGWDARYFNELDQQPLAAIGTLVREANPWRPLRKRLRDRYNRLRHRRIASASQNGKLLVFFLLIRKSLLQTHHYRFMQQGNISIDHVRTMQGGDIALLDLIELSQFVWHTSNITSLLTGQMDDPVLQRNFEQKWARLLEDPRMRQHLGDAPPER